MESKAGFLFVAELELDLAFFSASLIAPKLGYLGYQFLCHGCGGFCWCAVS